MASYLALDAPMVQLNIRETGITTSSLAYGSAMATRGLPDNERYGCVQTY